ncbi:MAG: hypothetical protein WCE94_15270 [Candidatus Methanoperedens sp.]
MEKEVKKMTKYLFSWEGIPGNDSKRLIEFLIHDYLTLEFRYLFSWDEIPGNDNGRLIEFLKKRFNIDWIETAKIEKIDDGRAIRLSFKNNFLSLKLNDEKTKVSLKIDHGRTDEIVARTEKTFHLLQQTHTPQDRVGKLNIYEYSIDWVKTARIEKIDDGKTIRVTNGKNFILLKLNNEKTEVKLEIDDGRTDDFITKTENGNLNIYTTKKPFFITNLGTGKTHTIYAHDGGEVISAAVAELTIQIAVLINLLAFLEDPYFGKVIKELFINTSEIFTTDKIKKDGIGIKFILVVTNANTNEEARKKATKLSEILTATGRVLDLNYFAAILAETTPQEVVDEVMYQHFSRVGVVLGPHWWVKNYMKLPKLKDSYYSNIDAPPKEKEMRPLGGFNIGIKDTIGAIVEVTPYSSDTFNFAQSVLLAAIKAVLFSSGTIPDDYAAEFEVRQQGQLIWAKEVHLPELFSAEHLRIFQAFKKLIADALSLDV